MTSRAYLIAIAMIGALAIAVPVSSQDVTRLLWSGSSWNFCGPGEVPPAPTTVVDASGKDKSASFRDNSFRIAKLTPLHKDNTEEPIVRCSAEIYEEPVLELLPPVEDEETMQPMTSEWKTEIAPELFPPVNYSETMPASVFEQIRTPQPAAVLNPDLFDPASNSSDKSKASSKDAGVDQDIANEKYLKKLKIWSGNFELGLDGTEGNSQTFNFHLGFDLKRKTKRVTFTSNLDYNKNNSDSQITVNRLLHESRLERTYENTPWNIYVHESTDYDEFQPWNVQINADTGVGYRLIETEATDLTVRFGGGFSKEIGGPEDAYVPELLFGGEWERRIGERHKYKLSVEYFPDVTDFHQYRMVDKASWEILIDKDHNLSLSLNVIDTINRPNPEGKEEDLNYSAVLLWNF